MAQEIERDSLGPLRSYHLWVPQHSYMDALRARYPAMVFRDAPHDSQKTLLLLKADANGWRAWLTRRGDNQGTVVGVVSGLDTFAKMAFNGTVHPSFLDPEFSYLREVPKKAAMTAPSLYLWCPVRTTDITSAINDLARVPSPFHVNPMPANSEGVQLLVTDENKDQVILRLKSLTPEIRGRIAGVTNSAATRRFYTDLDSNDPYPRCWAASSILKLCNPELLEALSPTVSHHEGLQAPLEKFQYCSIDYLRTANKDHVLANPNPILLHVPPSMGQLDLEDCLFSHGMERFRGKIAGIIDDNKLTELRPWTTVHYKDLRPLDGGLQGFLNTASLLSVFHAPPSKETESQTMTTNNTELTALPTLKDAAIAGAKLGAVHASGEALLDLARKLAPQMPMITPMLETLEGREALKILMATVIRYSAGAFPGQESTIHTVTDLQITSSVAILTGKYLGVIGETVGTMTKNVAALAKAPPAPPKVFVPTPAPSNVTDAVYSAAKSAQ